MAKISGDDTVPQGPDVPCCAIERRPWRLLATPLALTSRCVLVKKNLFRRWTCAMRWPSVYPGSNQRTLISAYLPV